MHPTYPLLSTQFKKLSETHAHAILSHQYAWEDFFAQSIYQYEVKDGTIKLYYEPKEPGKEIWWNNPLKRVINEWEGQTPKFLFNSIGEYLFFYKAIFHLDGALAVKIIANELIENTQAAYLNYLNENPNWKQIEKVLYGSLLEMLRHS